MSNVNDDGEQTDVLLYSIIGTVVATIFLFIAYSFVMGEEEPKKEEVKQVKQKGQTQAKKKNKKSYPKKAKAKELQVNTHKWHYATLKGHSDTIADVAFQPNGKFFATLSKDRTLRMWRTDAMDGNNIRHFQLFHTEQDMGVTCKFTNSGEQLLVSLENQKSVIFYNINEKKDPKKPWASGTKFASKLHSAPIVGADVAPNGYVLTCHSDTVVKLFTSNGKELKKLSTSQMRNHQACFSPNGNFIAIATFTTNIGIWEIQQNKEKAFSNIQKVMNLSIDGHKRSVNSVCFSPDNKKLFSASKDGTWKAWNIDVPYQRGGDAKCLLTVPLPDSPELDTILISPNSKLLAVKAKKTIYIFDATTGTLLETIAGSHLGDITAMAWSPDSSMFATGGTDYLVNILKVPTDL